MQRLHGRNPAALAAAVDVKKRTLSRRGRRDGHDGRQNTPVVVTAYQNAPSKRASRALVARHIWESVGIVSRGLSQAFIVGSGFGLAYLDTRVPPPRPALRF